MSDYIVLNHKSDKDTLEFKIKQCSFIGQYLTKEELDFMVYYIKDDKAQCIIFDTGYLIVSIKTEAGKLVCWGRLDGIKKIDEVAGSGMFFRNETQVIEREGIDPKYDKLLKSLVGYHEGALESAIWFQHIDLLTDYIPEMELEGEYLRPLIDSGVTDKKSYTIAIKEGEDHYEVTTLTIAFHKIGVSARSESTIRLSEAEFTTLIQVINQ